LGVWSKEDEGLVSYGKRGRGVGGHIMPQKKKTKVSQCWKGNVSERGSEMENGGNMGPVRNPKAPGRCYSASLQRKRITKCQ